MIHSAFDQFCIECKIENSKLGHFFLSAFIFSNLRGPLPKYFYCSFRILRLSTENLAKKILGLHIQSGAPRADQVWAAKAVGNKWINLVSKYS